MPTSVESVFLDGPLHCKNQAPPFDVSFFSQEHQPMPTSFSSLAPAQRRPRRFIRQIAALVLASTPVLMSQQQAQKPATPPTTKATQEKPQPKPDESATAAAALMQINNALEGLA